MDELFDLPDISKISANSLVRVAYQYPFDVPFKEHEQEEEAIPYTFEDALVLSNIDLFKDMNGATGLMGKMSNALSEPTIKEATSAMFLALELLYLKEPKELIPPMYIAEGLKWLQEKTKHKDSDFVNAGNDITGDD